MRTGKRVQFPRCRATVSEEIAAGHWGNLGRPIAVIRHFTCLTREPGDRREPSIQPFRVSKEDYAP
jgi:hypothetical protein